MSLYSASVDAIALSANTLKTLIEIQPASSARAKLVSWWVEFDSTNTTYAPVKVEVLRATAAITSSTSPTIAKVDDFAPNAISGVKHTATGEGTPGDVLEIHRIPPTSGILVQYPLGREIQVPVSGFLRIRCTSANAVNATVGIIFEE